MRNITDAELNLIKQFLGFSSTIYMCPAGYPKFGYGHVVLTHERVQFDAPDSTPEGQHLRIRRGLR